MDAPLSSTQVRTMLESFGAVRPSVQAIRVIAIELEPLDATRQWQLRYSPEAIKAALKDHAGLSGAALCRQLGEAARVVIEA